MDAEGEAGTGGMRVVLLNHEIEQAIAELEAGPAVGGIGGQVVGLVGVVEQVE